MSREEEIEYAREHGIPIPVDVESPYSIDQNLWGRSIECGKLEDPAQEPPEEVFEWTTPQAHAPDEPQYITVEFERGVPVAVDGERMDLVKLISHLNLVAGRHGIGRVDMIENRLVGIKSREVYEAPAAITLITAHKALEALTLERDLIHFKRGLELKYAEVVYYGLWYHPLREALDAFMDATQRTVTGTVRLKLFKGTCMVVGRESPFSLYRYELATYDRADQFDHRASEGFIKIFGLPTMVTRSVLRRLSDEG